MHPHPPLQQYDYQGMHSYAPSPPHPAHTYGARPSMIPQLSGVAKTEAGGEVEYQLSSLLPEM